MSEPEDDGTPKPGAKHAVNEFSLSAQISGTYKLGGILPEEPPPAAPPADPIARALAQVPPRFGDVQAIGSGGMGVVFRARDTVSGRDVAIKMLGADHWRDEHAVKRFVLEARALARLTHPAILRIHEIHRGEVPFFTMELLEGQTLEESLQGERPPLPVLIRRLLPVLEALEHCHESGLVHRDVKPRNIFVTHTGESRLMDFGIVKGIGNTSMTGAGIVMGTPQFMSPEQILGTDVDHRADIFAFGITLYQVITGELPFASESEVFTSSAPGLRDRADVPAEVAAAVARCLMRSPANRFQSAREVLQALLPFAAQDTAGTSGMTSREVFTAVVFEALKDGTLSDAGKELIFAVRRLLDIPAEVHQEVFRDAQARVRVGRGGGATPGEIPPEAIYRLVVRRHLKAAGSEVSPLLDDVGRLLEISRARRRQLERELAEELRLESAPRPG